MDVDSPFSLTPRHTVAIIQEGYRKEEPNGIVMATGGITLILGPHNVLIGTGSSHDRDVILRGLLENKTSPESIEYVICTHAHPENIGNLNLFPEATHIVGFDIVRSGRYIMHDFTEGIPYEIDDDIEVVATPGITHSAVSVMISNCNLGTVAIAGSVFDCAEDLEDPDIWISRSLDPDTQQQSRIQILRDAEHIVPRYGQLFTVPATYKTEMKVVMTP